jgi:hypothetical protein
MKDPNYEDARIRISAVTVRSALHFAAKQDVRYYLEGVQVRPDDKGGALAIGCDGHAMVCMRDESGFADRQCILPLTHADARHLKTAHTVCVDASGRPFIVDKNHEITWISPKLEITASYPDIAKVLQPLTSYEEGLVGTFNPAYIDRIKRAAPARYAQVRFFHEKGKEPHNAASLFTLGRHGFGLIMPMRGDDDALKLAVPASLLAEVA